MGSQRVRRALISSCLASLVAQMVKSPPGLYVGDLGSIPGLVRLPGGGHGNPLQYSCLENPHGQRSLAGYSWCSHKDADMTEQLSIARLCSWMIFTIVTFLFILTKVGNLCFRNIKPKSLSERKSTGSWNYTDQIKISKRSPWEKGWTFIYLTTNDRTGLLLTQKVPFQEFLNGTCSLICFHWPGKKKKIVIDKSTTFTVRTMSH